MVELTVIYDNKLVTREAVLVLGISDYFLMIRKHPYREGDHLAFKVYKHEINELMGVTYHHKIVEHFERLAFYEKNKANSITDILVIEETNYEIYYSINNNAYVVGSLSEIAIEIANAYSDYKQQFVAFVEKIQQMGVSKYQ